MRDIRQLAAIVLWRMNDKQIIRVAHNSFVSGHGVEISATAAKDFESADHLSSACEVERNTYCISRRIGKRNSTAASQVESTRYVAILVSVPAEAGRSVRHIELGLEEGEDRIRILVADLLVRERGGGAEICLCQRG